MKIHRPAPFVTIALMAMVALAASCSDKATNPPGGGVQPKELDSGPIVSGGVYAHTFANAGTFNYICTIHSGMSGQVVVTGSTDSVLVTIANNSFTPASASVKQGGRVRWINTGNTHTVTSP